MTPEGMCRRSRPAATSERNEDAPREGSTAGGCCRTPRGLVGRYFRPKCMTQSVDFRPLKRPFARPAPA